MAGRLLARSELEGLRKPGLVGILRSASLPITGTKDVLIDRILEYYNTCSREIYEHELELTKLEIASMELALTKFNRSDIRLQSTSISQGQAMEYTCTDKSQLQAHHAQINPSQNKEKPIPKPRLSLSRAANNTVAVPVNNRQAIVHAPFQTQYFSSSQSYDAVKGLQANEITPQPDTSTQAPVHYLSCSNQPYSASQSTCMSSANQAKIISEIVEAAKMPSIEPPKFSGDILAYPRWNKAFNAFLQRRNLSASDKLYYLENYTCGEAAEIIQSYLYLNSDLAYTQAKAALDDTYGNSFLVAQAFKSKLANWPKLSANDGIGLSRLTNFLKQCLTALNEIPSLQSLNECEKNQDIVRLLPSYIAIKWNSKVTEYQIAHSNSFPPFKYFVDFLEFESKVACNPVTSQTALKQPNSDKHQSYNTGTKPKSSFKIVTSHNTHAANTENSKTCPMCSSSEHIYLSKCDKFKALPVEERETTVRAVKACLRCLGLGHSVSKCKKDWVCARCKGVNHHTLLHRQIVKAIQSNTCDPQIQTVDATCRATSSANPTTQLFSMTVLVWVSTIDNPDKEILTYALLDSQSNLSFITNDLAESLNPDSEQSVLKITTMTSKDKVSKTRKFKNLQVRGYSCKDAVALPRAYGESYIPCDHESIPSYDNIMHAAKTLPHLFQVAQYIAPKQNCPAGLLLGQDCIDAIAVREVVESPVKNRAYGAKTSLGWCVVGPTTDLDTHKSENLTHCITHRICISDITPSELMKQIEGLDFQGPTTSERISQDDLTFLKIMDSEAFQHESGHYVMPLPFRENHRHLLRDNSKPVLKRFHSLLSQFKHRHARFKSEYTNFMDGILSRGEAELVPASQINASDCWYLPHHGVYHKKTGKLRVVFDCSSQHLGVSLNSTLLQGPDLNNSLLGVLLRFRLQPIAISCDIEKMYHRFHVIPKHRDYMRFLWLDADERIQTYRMCVHIFGATSSPSCAKYGLSKIAQEHGSNYTEAQKFIQRNFYVDDGLCSVKTPEQAVKLLTETKAICEKGNLRVHKLLSNNLDVLEAFPSEDTNLDISSDVELLNTERALGMLWSLQSDSFKYKYEPSEKTCTRRSILANVASIYDPMGLLSPLILSGRIMIQQACKSGIDWDEVLGDETATRWKLWNTEMSKISTVSISRCIRPPSFDATIHEIHTFADASNVGYGACSYVRLHNSEGAVYCALMIGKSRVAPLKSTTIPRLELQAAVLAARQNHSLRTELEWECKSYLWSDSKIVLGYIHNDSKRFHTYVANRLSQIHDLTSTSTWHYVKSEENPADLASRGLSSVENLIHSIWFGGPSFLWSDDLPTNQSDKYSVDPEDKELRQSSCIHAIKSELSVSALEQSIANIVQNSSSWAKTVRNVNVVRNVVANHSFRDANSFTIESRKCTEYNIIRIIQKLHFNSELHLLKHNLSLDKSSRLWRLDCFIDTDGIMRVGGRTRISDLLTSNEKHPIILPQNSNLSTQIIRHFHERVAHQGRTSTMSAVRSAGYWIVGLSQSVASLIFKCTTCRRLRRPTEVQKMADLPADRLDASPPFSYVGCDVFGPFPVKEGRRNLKRYGLLFTCLVSRAVHIEILDDLSADSFLQSWRCFISLRGDVRLLRCDNGTNFRGAHNELANAAAEMLDDSVKKYLMANQCEFKFNPPHASHNGGCWERLIRSVRNVFSGLTQQMHNLSTSSLRSLMYECMAIMNSRPLTSINVEQMPLCPNNLLHIKPKGTILPLPGQFDSSDIYAKKRWRTIQLLSNLFWSRWKKEYLHQLQARQKWHRTKRNLALGDIVILADESNRLGWKLGKVVEAKPSLDGLVRSVVVECHDSSSGRKSSLCRPVSKLVCLVENNSK